MSFAAFLQTVSAKLVLFGVGIVMLCVVSCVHDFDLRTLSIRFLSRVHTLTTQLEKQQSPSRILRNESVSTARVYIFNLFDANLWNN